MTDGYTKAMLTLIAIGLLALNVQLLRPTPSKAGLFDGTPTRGDLVRLSDIQDEAQRSAAAKELAFSIPLVWVQGGKLAADVRGSVEIE